MLRQVAYDTLSRRDRKARHLAVAAHLRTAFPGDGEEVTEVIAQHYLDALNALPDAPDATQIRSQAVAVINRAAERAERTGAPAQAAASRTRPGPRPARRRRRRRDRRGLLRRRDRQPPRAVHALPSRPRPARPRPVPDRRRSLRFPRSLRFRGERRDRRGSHRRGLRHRRPPALPAPAGPRRRPGPARSRHCHPTGLTARRPLTLAIPCPEPLRCAPCTVWIRRRSR
jgi:hypothetical protein